MPAKQKIEFETEKPWKCRAKLYRDGRLFAIGSAEGSKDSVTFYPKNPKTLAALQNRKIKMKVNRNVHLMKLECPEELLDLTTNEIWMFQIQKHT